MTMSQIEHFIRTAELLSFSKAADALYMSQPALSKEISRLEKDLGFPLFIRDTRNVQLTPAGLSYYKGVVEVLNMYRGITEKALRISKSAPRVVRIGGRLVNRRMLVTVEGAKGLINSQELPFEVMINKSDSDLGTNWLDPSNALSEGSLGDNDIELLFNSRTLEDSVLETTFLYRDRLALFATKDSGLAPGQDVRFEDLANFAFMTAAASNSDFNEAFSEACSAFNFEPKIRKRLIETMGDMVSQCAQDEIILITESMKALIPRPELVGLIELNLAEDRNYVDVVAACNPDPDEDIARCLEALVQIAQEE